MTSMFWALSPNQRRPGVGVDICCEQMEALCRSDTDADAGDTVNMTPPLFMGWITSPSK